jgi:hypothetical protein
MTFPFLPVRVEFFAIFTYCLHFVKVKNGYGEKLGLDWRNRKKISPIINDYLYLPFFLLFTEPEFFNFYGAQESIPRNQFRQPM